MTKRYLSLDVSYRRAGIPFYLFNFFNVKYLKDTVGEGAFTSRKVVICCYELLKS